MTRRERRAIVVTVIPIVGAVGIVVALWDRPWTFPRVLGLALMLLGFALLTVARINLGDAFSVRPEATKLVMRALYSRIRNPIYVFGTLTIAGIILFIDKPAFLTLLLPVVALQMWRARTEGRVLESKFGEEYRRYRARTWF